MGKPARTPRRILVVKTHAIGDLLMTTPALRDLRAAHPTAQITLLTGKWSADAVRKNPRIDAILEFEDRILLDAPRHPLAVLRLLARVRAGRYDTAVVFHPSPALHLLVSLAGIPVRYGLARGGASRFLTEAVEEDLGPDTYYPVNFQRVAALTGAASGEPSLEVHWDADDEREAGEILRRSGIGEGSSYVLVAPGGGRNSKEDVAARRWPAERFVELLAEVRRTRPDLGIVVTGSRGDAPETGRVAAAFPDAADLTGKTPMRSLFVLARGASAVICNDSSMLHVAVAVGRPVVVPFGPTGLRQRLPAWARDYSVQGEVPCSPCYVGGRFPGCTIGFKCLRDMPVTALRARLERALASA